jgi:hypothetical protein
VCRDRLDELRGGGKANADAIGIVEVGVFARRLQAVDHLARPPLGDELGRQRGVEHHQQLAVAGRRQARLLDQSHLDFARLEDDRLAVDFDREAAVALQGFGERVAVGGLEGGLERRHLPAQALAENREDRLDLVAHELGAALGPADVLHIELVEEEIPHPLDLAAEVAPGSPPRNYQGHGG